MGYYRKILVDKTEYEYHIGKNFIVIKGLKRNGNISKTDFFNDYRGIDGDLVVKEIVTPGMIADFINGNKIRIQKRKYPTPSCSCKKPLSEKRWRCDPFDAEVCEEYNYAFWCDGCFQKREWDI